MLISFVWRFLRFNHGKYFFFIIHLLAFSFLSSKAQQKKNDEYPVIFEHYTTDEGLIRNSGYCFAQDSIGFLWIGSAGGLERFDGDHFIVYKTRKDHRNSISNTRIWTLYIDRSNELWIGTGGGGLNKYIRSKDGFISYQFDKNNPNSISNNVVSCILQDISGQYWVGTRGGGINLFDPKTGKFTRFMNKAGENSCLKDNIVHSLCLDNTGLIWIATESGLTILDPRVKHFRNYYMVPGDLEQFSGIPILSIANDKSGEIWLGTWQKGLSKILLGTGKIENYHHHGLHSFEGNTVWDIFIDSNGDKWFGTDNGMYRYRSLTGDFKRFVSDVSDPKSLSENFIRNIYEDSKGVLWIGTNNAGLDKLDLYSKKFRLYSSDKHDFSSLSCLSVKAICEDFNGRIWLGTCNGLDLFSKDKGSFERFYDFSEKKGDELFNDINAIVSGEPPYIWLGTNFGLTRFNTQTHQFFRFTHNAKIPNSLSNNAVFSLHYDKKGLIWIGTWGGGLDQFDPVKGVFTNYPIDKQISTSNVVLTIIEDRHNNLWLGTYGHGLVKFNKESHLFTYYTADPDRADKLKDNVILCLYQRSENEIWVGTAGGGLSNFNPQTGVFKNYSQEDGLPSVEIKSIQEDGDKNLWLSSGNGLSKLEFIKNKNSAENRVVFKNFDAADGLQSNSFNQGASCKSSTGELYFGGIAGLNVFQYDEIKANPFLPNVVITSLQILNKPVKTGDTINGKVILNEPIYKIKEITLSHREYVFSLEFAALHFAIPSKNMFLYKLEGFDKDWIKTGTKRHFATYSNLDPGEYVFRVKASNNDGTWNERETTLNIIIFPPWWKTLWFRTFLCVSALIIIFLIYWIRFKQMQIQKQILNEKILERTLELQQANMELLDSQEEIKLQNEELEDHRAHLEKLVEVRTKDLELALHKVEESDKLKTSFIANMSHEIRTPMNAIVGFSFLLKDRDPSKAERDEYINIINKNCESLLVLINDILDISKIEANQLDIIKAQFSVNETLEELEQFFKMNALGKVNVDYKKLYPNIYIENDSARFRQVMSNLLTNALKFTDEGTVEFGFEILDGYLKFYVADSGIGIDKSEFKTIFDQFRKIEDDRTRLYGGTGLGLAISKSLVECMGGRIWVESEKGRGATFYFTLPYQGIYVPREKTVNKEIEATPSSDWAGIHILIAEDEPTNFYYLKMVIKSKNAKVLWARNGYEAVEFIRMNNKYHIKLVLMDIKMPGMNGFEALTSIKQICPNLPVLAQSAYAQEVDIQSALRLGFSEYLVKPIKPETLLELIQKYI